MTPDDLAAVATGQRQLAEALADNEHLRRLASGFAHDFNNLLAVITGYTDLMLRCLRPNDPLRNSAESIKKATEWGIALAEQVVAASRRQGPPRVAVGVNQAVTNVTRVLQRVIGDRIELVTQLDHRAGDVAVNQGQLGQIVMNLVVNARDAMPDGGTLTVSTKAAGDQVVLSVSDTGIGIDAATRARLFEPYFTTKGPGKGTGLGLATVQDVVNQHGGRVEVTSAAGFGSTFRIVLPRVGGSPAPSDATVPGPLGPVAATVLVVEDETEVRELVHEILQGERYAVLEAADDEEARALAERHAGPIDLLVVDVVLPAWQTEERVARIASGRPGVRVLYLSGYLDDAEGIDELRRRGFVLQKPFTVSAFAAAVREVLATPA